MPGRRLYRSTTDRKIGGVCSGIADYLDADPVIVRLVAVAMILIPGPPTLIIYLIACLVIPNQPAAAANPAAYSPAQQAEYVPPGGAPGGGAAAEPTPPPPSGNPAAAPAAGGRQGEHRGSLIFGLAIFWLGILFLCLNLGIFDWRIFQWWRWRTIWPLMLIALGGWMLWRSVRNERAGAGA